jgi:hypothetical protein
MNRVDATAYPIDASACAVAGVAKRIDARSTAIASAPFLTTVAQDATAFDRVTRERITSTVVFAQEASFIASSSTFIAVSWNTSAPCGGGIPGKS